MSCTGYYFVLFVQVCGCLTLFVCLFVCVWLFGCLFVCLFACCGGYDGGVSFCCQIDWRREILHQVRRAICFFKI